MLLESVGEQTGEDLITDRVYAGDAIRGTAAELGYAIVTQPKRNRRNPWEHDWKK